LFSLKHFYRDGTKESVLDFLCLNEGCLKSKTYLSSIFVTNEKSVLNFDDPHYISLELIFPFEVSVPLRLAKRLLELLMLGLRLLAWLIVIHRLMLLLRRVAPASCSRSWSALLKSVLLHLHGIL